MCFVRCIYFGFFIVREVDVVLLCVMFVSVVGKRNFFAYIDYVNKVYLIKIMNEGFVLVMYYILE